jgi:acetyl-CoA acetyltransferase
MNSANRRQRTRALFKTPITVEDVLNSRVIAYPFRLLRCCLVTDGGGAMTLVAVERASDFPQKPVYLLGTGESVETPVVSQPSSFLRKLESRAQKLQWLPWTSAFAGVTKKCTSSRAFRVAGPAAVARPASRTRPSTI